MSDALIRRQNHDIVIPWPHYVLNSVGQRQRFVVQIDFDRSAVAAAVVVGLAEIPPPAVVG